MVTDRSLDAVPHHDRVCSYIDCVVSEPDRLSLRSFRNCDHVAVYCDRHDPLLDESSRSLWEPHNGD